MRDTGAVVVYMGDMFAGAVVGAAVGLVLALDGATWHRVWQLAACGAYLAMGLTAVWMAWMTGGGSGDPGRPDVVSSRDGRE